MQQWWRTAGRWGTGAHGIGWPGSGYDGGLPEKVKISEVPNYLTDF